MTRSTPSAASRTRARYSARSSSAAATSSSRTRRQRSILPRTFSPYSSSLPGKSTRWTSATSRMKSARLGGASGNSISRRRGKTDAAAPTRSRTSGSARSSQATPTSSSSSDSSAKGSKPGASARSSRSQPPTDDARGPTTSKLGASGKQPSTETSPCVGLKPATPHAAHAFRREPAASPPALPAHRPGAPARSRPLLEVEVEQRDPDAAGEKEHEDAEQHPAETDVPARELGIHQITASTASAA